MILIIWFYLLFPMEEQVLNRYYGAMGYQHEIVVNPIREYQLTPRLNRWPPFNPEQWDRKWPNGYCDYNYGYGLEDWGWPSLNHNPDRLYAPNYPGIRMTGTNQVMAANSGIVTWAGYDMAGGMVVVISHGMGYISRYSHLDNVVAYCGQYVNRGQIIGDIGQSGGGGIEALRFEIIYNGLAIDPMLFLPVADKVTYDGFE